MDELGIVYQQLTNLKEQADMFYNIVDMSDSFTFNREDGMPAADGLFDAGVAYSQALARPSATACAYVTEGVLRIIRARSRAFCVANPYWMAVREARISYAVGTGHILSVVAKHPSRSLDPDLRDKVSSELEKFYRVNRYRIVQGEKITRLDRDGEFFLRFQDNRDDGILRVNFLEPLLIQDPPGLGPQQGVWFGIQFDNNQYEEPTGYYLRPADYLGGDLSLEHVAAWRTPLPADEVQRRTANVDMSSPRGLPSTYALQERLVQALSTLKSMGKMVDVRARIAIIRKQVNATLQQIQPLLLRQRAGQSTGAGGILRNVFQYPYGTIIDTNDQRTFELPSPNLETDKIVHSVKADLQSVAAALGLADFVISADSQTNFAAALVKEGPMDRSISRLQ